MFRASPILLLIVALLTSSCSKPADSRAREKELGYLRCMMPESLLEFAHLEVPGLENVAIVREGTNQHLGLRVFPGQKKVNGGIRAEISVDYPFRPGDTVRYAWRFMVPAGSPSDAPMNRWWLIGQWHDQPDEGRDETWSGFPSRSPPVLLGFGEKENRLAMNLVCGVDQSHKGVPVFIEPGKWHQVAIEIHWSRQVDGNVTLYFDDLTKPASSFEGPNMHNDYQHYLKLGMYRHPDIQTDNWIYLDDLAITTLAVR